MIIELGNSIPAPLLLEQLQKLNTRQISFEKFIAAVEAISSERLLFTSYASVLKFSTLAQYAQHMNYNQADSVLLETILRRNFKLRYEAFSRKRNLASLTSSKLATKLPNGFADDCQRLHKLLQTEGIQKVGHVQGAGLCFDSGKVQAFAIQADSFSVGSVQGIINQHFKDLRVNGSDFFVPGNIVAPVAGIISSVLIKALYRWSMYQLASRCTVWCQTDYEGADGYCCTSARGPLLHRVLLA